MDPNRIEHNNKTTKSFIKILLSYIIILPALMWSMSGVKYIDRGRNPGFDIVNSLGI
jgi:hypothetical protein